ncbi:hypothetical protein Nepgr_007247 [Nepenthes gracilis]|uniref:Uncharacterized protein n=1 Tax=Nepenthes gracilis TaxID=150966 RepID=A0AAD3S6H7_NEPGR|nr:hypothetical protein Nepgr_007247 [Nepenthes gracilis]
MTHSGSHHPDVLKTSESTYLCLYLYDFAIELDGSKNRKAEHIAGGARRKSMANGPPIETVSQGKSGRLIPKRGQVKIGIAVCIAHSVASSVSGRGGVRNASTAR